MPYVLQECYIILNIALCFLALGDAERGIRYIDQSFEASKNASISPDMLKIEDCLSQGQDSPSFVNPYEIPDGLIYRPQNDNIKNAEKVDYLGASKVIAGVDRQDNFAGFSGRQQKVFRLWLTAF